MNDQKSDTAKREEQILAFWNEKKIFEKSLAKDSPNGDFVFYDGPPFATGLPHYGHIVASVIKDVVPRYWTMRGYHVPRVWGWDCHGLPIENIVEKELGFKHKKDIAAMGVKDFNERCRAQVLTYASEWEKIIPRIGRWVDMKNAYRTMDKPFMESVWWVFKQLYDKKLVYEDYRSMLICPRCETTLSQQEVSEGYKDVKDIAVTVKFKVKNPEKHGLPENTFLLAWTTTPWTLPGNVALAIGKDIDYSLWSFVGDGSQISTWNERLKVSMQKGESYVTSMNFFDPFAVSVAEHANFLEKALLNKKMEGIEYEPIFDYYAKDTTLKNHANGWKVYAADFVTTDTGTGIVHIAPAFGEDDMRIGKEKNLPFVQHVGMDGTMKPEVKDFAGRSVSPRIDGDEKTPREIDRDIVRFLGDKLFKTEKYPHSYPHCWRCDTALLNYATTSWFVSVTKIKEQLLKNAEAINWSPEHIKEGRFGKWLEGARDWSISRQRFWASVIPVWRCHTCKAERVFESAGELEKASGKKVDDLHKHIVDDIAVSCVCGKEMRRIPDVLDTWFDSGSMPYGERHYPFDDKEKFENVFPAQFIAEGIDQTRAWFYYLHVLAGAIFEKNAFQHVIVNGIVLAEDGKKMSKKLKNYPDPMLVVDKYGADALRFYLMSSPVVQAENLNFAEKGVDDVLKKNIGRLNNVLEFYKLYANDTPRDAKSEHVLDRWIIARLNQLIAETTVGYESYRLDLAVRPTTLFIDDLSVWYLRRSRERFKEDIADKQSALATLRFILHQLSLVIAPVTPFFAEYLFQAVKESTDAESVHLMAWPPAGDVNSETLLRMKQARLAVEHILMARDDRNIKVKQPLSEVALNADFVLSPELVDIVKQETNIKKITFHRDIQVIRNLHNQPDWFVFDDFGTFQLAINVAINVKITPELAEEGLVRELIRSIQQYRKQNGMKPGEHGAYIVIPENRGIAEKYRTEIEKVTDMKLDTN